MSDDKNYVLDASVVLAYLFEEPGAKYVASILEEDNGLISSVNYAEVVSKLVDKNIPSETIQTIMASLELDCISQDTQQAFHTGKLRKASKPFGLSLGDRSCLALGITRDLTVLTADPLWLDIPVEVDIQLIRD